MSLADDRTGVDARAYIGIGIAMSSLATQNVFS